MCLYPTFLLSAYCNRLCFITTFVNGEGGNGSGYDTALLGNWFPTFRKKGFQGPFELQALENEGTTFLRNVGNRLPHDAVSHPRRQLCSPPRMIN